MSKLQFQVGDLRLLLEGNVSILCHHNADPDTICAAYGLLELSKHLNPNAWHEILLPSGASTLSRKVMGIIGIEAKIKLTHENPDVFVLVDTGSLSQLADWENKVRDSQTPIIVVDHHPINSELEKIAKLYINDPEATSTCEIVYNIFRCLGIQPSESLAKALLTGIAFDSKFFQIGQSTTFRAVSELLSIGGTIPEIREILSITMDNSEVIAHLKAAQRMKIHMVKGWMAITTQVGSFQSSTARAILKLGADVAIVAGNDKGKLKVSMRSTPRFYRETSIHLGKI